MWKKLLKISRIYVGGVLEEKFPKKQLSETVLLPGNKFRPLHSNQVPDEGTIVVKVLLIFVFLCTKLLLPP